MARGRIVRNWQLGPAVAQFESEMTLELRRRTGFEADWAHAPDPSVVDLVVEFASDSDHAARAEVAEVVREVVAQTIINAGDDRARLVEFLGGDGEPVPPMYVAAPASELPDDYGPVNDSESEARDP